MTYVHHSPARPPSQGRVTAVLGPTNTGKTYLAMDRMLGHATGMIGFPLRLLARENYDRVVKLKGRGAVALITGEEKIIPAHPRYFICTVESMPLDRQVAFLAVDEIQLAADSDRGHIFTDRLLHARGDIETMFLGAETIKPLIRRLVPGVEFVTRPRFSKLLYTGAKKLTRLPRRSAVVAFSVSEVYGIAELIRRHRGGAAVVMGALSPRTRNAQVALYQNGDVDYMVATDAIGMGLNMDVDHVAFASLVKFDGRAPRALAAPEVAQIAGRAGRHMNDGTFGVTADSPELDPDVIERVEAHEFPPLQHLYWRNTKLKFTSVESLLGGLRQMPPAKELVRPPPAEDQLVLEAMVREPDVKTRITGVERVRLLWDVAQVPDFRKLRPEVHARFMTQVYLHLTDSQELPEDWVAGHVERIDRTDGDIHVLMDRIAAIRTWTFLAHRSDWMKDSLGWQERTKVVEDRLSDALHEKLTHQFVDTRTAHLVKRMRNDDLMTADVSGEGLVEVDGHRLGQLEGLRFRAERTGLTLADRTVFNAANAALRPVLAARVADLVAAGDDAFSLDLEARIVWREEALAMLVPGPDLLRPQVEVHADERVEAPDRRRVEERLRAWIANHIAQVLKPLVIAGAAEMTPAVRGIIFQLTENLGSLERLRVERQVASLTKADRTALARLGVRLGVGQVFMPALLKPQAIDLRARLWRAAHRDRAIVPLPPGRINIPLSPEVDPAFYAACGYQPIGAAAYRVDMLERFAAEARKQARAKAELLAPPTLSLIGATAEAAVPVLKALGFRAKLRPEGLAFGFRRKAKVAEAPAPAGSPFAKLKELIPT